MMLVVFVGTRCIVNVGLTNSLHVLNVSYLVLQDKLCYKAKWYQKLQTRALISVKNYHIGSLDYILDR